jgi:uncharacterized OB-fold protein
VGKQIGIVDYLILDDGEPHLVANECEACQALYFDRRNACAKCGQRSFGKKKLSTSGTVRTFTIVTRGAPGVPAPFVSAVIDLDGGGVVKANIIDTEVDPTVIAPGLPVRLSTFVAGTDGDGTEAVAFGFTPATLTEGAAS